MAEAVVYGSITIVDLMDVGEFSVQPTSNLPLSVLYDPDQNSYNPNWSGTALVLEPLVYYGGDRVALGTSGLTVDWSVQEGTRAASNMTNNGAILPSYSDIGYSIVDNGKLKAERNQFIFNASMLTYVVTATYNEPDSGQTLVSKGQITFSLVRNASEAKTCTITGENIFKYNASGAISGSSSITLTGRVTNTSISGWQYWDGTYTSGGEKNWVAYPRTATGNTLEVKHDDNTFVNDQCLVRLATADANVYDIHTITKLRDGAAGISTITAVLTNDDQSIPESGGTVDYSAATTRLIIYSGGVEDTVNWTITLSASAGVTYTSSTTAAAQDTVAVTNMTTNSGTVTFTARKTGNADVIKTFSVIKVPAGADAPALVTYTIDSSVYAINAKKENNTTIYTPSTVTFYGYTQTAGQDKQPYTCRFKIYENLTYEAYKAADPKPTGHTYFSTADEESHTYTPTGSASTILCVMFDKGSDGTTKELDIQQVVITSDGEKGDDGQPGAKGDAAINVTFGNYSDTLQCTSNNTLASEHNIVIPFAAYEGTTKIPCTFTAIPLLGVQPNAIDTSSTSSKYATATQDGQIVWTLPAGTSVPNPSGNLSIQFTVTTSKNETRTIYQSYSWTRSKDGVSSIMMQIYSPITNTLDEDSVRSTTLQAMLTEGTTDVTSQATSLQWYKFINGTYSPISEATTAQLTVNVDDVDSYASFRCRARYDGNDYDAYFSVFDKTDPIQVAVLSSVGNQLVNGIGECALYVKVTRNGQEIDKIKSERFLTSGPSTATKGDYYYLIDKTNKSVILMHFNGSTWANVTPDPYEGTYTWSWRDKNGNTITHYDDDTKLLPTEGKVVYIDGDMIDRKIIADVEVTI